MKIKLAESKTSLDSVSTVVYLGSDLAPLIRYNVSTSSLEDLAEFAEYDFKYKPEKEKFTDSTPLSFLDTEIRGLIGRNTEDLKVVENSLFPTRYISGTIPEDQGYFGSFLVDDKYALLLDIPENYSTVYIYDTEVELSDIGGDYEGSDWCVKIELQESKEVIRDGNRYIENEVAARDIVWLILVSDPNSSDTVNLAYQCWIRSINPARNKSDLDLRNDDFYSVSGEILTNNGLDIQSGSVLGGKKLDYTPLLRQRLRSVSGWCSQAHYREDQVCDGWFSVSDSTNKKPGVSTEWVKESTISDLAGLDKVYISLDPGAAGELFFTRYQPAEGEFSLPIRHPAEYDSSTRTDYYDEHPEIERPKITFMVNAKEGYAFHEEDLLTNDLSVSGKWYDYARLGAWTYSYIRPGFIKIEIPYKSIGDWEDNGSGQEVLRGVYNLWDDQILPAGGDIFVRMFSAITYLLFKTDLTFTKYLRYQDGKYILDTSGTMYRDDYIEFSSDLMSTVSPRVDPVSGGYYVPVNINSLDQVTVITSPNNILQISEVDGMVLRGDKLVPSSEYTSTLMTRWIWFSYRQLKLSMSSTNYFGLDMSITSKYYDFPDTIFSIPDVSDAQFALKPSHHFVEDSRGYVISINIRFGNTVDKVIGFTSINISTVQSQGAMSIPAINSGEIPDSTVTSSIRLSYDINTEIYTLTFVSFMYDADVVININ